MKVRPHLPRYLHPHLILPLKVSPVINPPTLELPNLSVDSPIETALSRNIFSKRPANIGPPNRSAADYNNCATPIRASSVRSILPYFFPDFSDLLLSLIVLQNLSNGNFNFEEGGASSSTTETSSDPTPPYDYQETARTVVAIEILPEGVTSYSPRSSPSTTPTSSPLSSTFPPSTFHHSQPRPISVIDPTVTFTSRSSMVARSSFTVLRDGQAVHNETAEVNLLSTSVDAGPSDIDCIFYYTAPLVPGFWSTICQDQGQFFYGRGALLLETFIHRTDQPIAYRSRQIFDYPRHLSAPWIGHGVIQCPRTRLSDSLRRVSIYVSSLAVFLTPALSCRVFEQYKQLVALALIFPRGELSFFYPPRNRHP